MQRRSLEILDALSGLRLAVVGDAMLDRFLWGEVERISPEAPVPVVRLREETDKLGGAANVAANIRALGATVDLFAVAGVGETSRSLAAMLESAGIGAQGVQRIPGRRTTLKTRIIAHHQQVVRVDNEADTPLPSEVLAALGRDLRAGGPYAGIVVSDYGKGLLTPQLLAAVMEWAAAGVPVVVDPKHGDFGRYAGCTSLTPNQNEAASATGERIDGPDGLRRTAEILLRRTGARSVLITRGENGMALFEAGGEQHHLPTEATEVYDVTGAGDTVIAVYTAALAAGATFLEAANLANHAAGLAVRELGTAAITADQIREVIAS